MLLQITLILITEKISIQDFATDDFIPDLRRLIKKYLSTASGNVLIFIMVCGSNFTQISDFVHFNPNTAQELLW